MVLLTGKEKRKLFPRSIAKYQILGNVFICSNNEAISGTAAAIGATTLVKLMRVTVILGDPSVFCTGQLGKS